MATIKSGPPNEQHRHLTSGNKWSDKTDLQSNQPHSHNVTLPDPVISRAEFDMLVARVEDLESAESSEPPPPVEPPPPPPPVIPPGSATPNIPTAITTAATNGADVTSAIQAWLQGLLSGATAVFGVGATYLCNGQIHLTNRAPLTVDQNTSRIQQKTRGNSPIILIDQGGSGVVWGNGDIMGPNPNPGLWEYAYEHNHGIAIGGVNGFETNKLRIINVGGDGYYLSGGANLWAKNVHIHDGLLSGIGRMGVAITDGLSGGLIENMALDHIGYYTFDIEPNGATVEGRLAGAEHVKILHNTIGPIPYGRNPVISGQATGQAFVTTNTSAKGTQPIINDIEVGWNVITDPAWPDFRVLLAAPQGTAIYCHDNVK